LIYMDIKLETFLLYYNTELLFNGIISLLFQGDHMDGIISMVSLTEDTLNAKSITVSYKMFGLLLILMFIRISVYVYFSLNKSIMAYFLCFVLLFSLFLNYLSKILFFDVLFHRMRLLRKAFKNKYLGVNVIGKERIKHRIENIKTCLSVYDYLLQQVENMDLELEIWLFGTVLLYFPKAVLFMRNAMMLILNKELFSFKTLWTVLTLLYTICLGTWPMVLFELTKNEVDIIKDILFKQSLLDTDETLHLEIQRALQHINLRPCQYQVCRMMPLGVSLPLSFVSLCITYVIVLVQLTPVK
ncbi:uncharacterized protein LOC120633516, partial [Pararge aegeria]